MAILPQSVERLAHIGANVEISSEAGYLPASIEKILHIAVGRGSHVTIHAGRYLPDTLERFAQIGRGNVTIKV